MTVQITWDDLNTGATQEDGFRVYRSTSAFDKNSLPSVLATVAADETSYDDATAPSGTNLFYMVSAYKGSLARFSELKNIVTASDQPAGSVLLIGAEGSDGSTTIIDESPVGRTLTASGACAIETTGALAGTSSLAINQANESTGHLSCGASSDFNFGTGDFTIEGWAKSNFNDGSFTHFLIGNLTYADDGTWGLNVKNNPNNYLEFSVGDTVSSLIEITATTGDVNTTAFHFAVSRNGNTIRLFKDGVMVGKNTGFTYSVGNSGAAVYVGWNGAGASGEKWRGLIDELRVVKGTGLYNSDSSFTPVSSYPR